MGIVGFELNLPVTVGCAGWLALPENHATCMDKELIITPVCPFVALKCCMLGSMHEWGSL